MSPTDEIIKRETARLFNLTRSELEGPARSQRIARPRQIAMTLCRLLTSRSLPEIGRRFGGRDHTTVLHAMKAVHRRAVENGVQRQLSQICAVVEMVLNARRITALNRLPPPGPILLLPPPKGWKPALPSPAPKPVTVPITRPLPDRPLKRPARVAGGIAREAA